MFSDFIEFCQQLFPSIDPYTKDQAKHCMDQFEKTSKPLLTRFTESPILKQGDIFSEIPFFYLDKDGEQKMLRCKAQLLSNTCDAVRDKTLIFAALHPLTDYMESQSMIDGIKRNKRYSAFYLPDNPISEEFVDFEMINTISRECFQDLLSKGKVNKLASLTLVGYYMLLCKLTVFLMRPEDVDINENR